MTHAALFQVFPLFSRNSVATERPESGVDLRAGSSNADAAANCTYPNRSLAPRAFIPIPVRNITPQGWLLDQLVVHAEGLSGHLALFFHEVMNSMWVGGDFATATQNRFPYWSVIWPRVPASRLRMSCASRTIFANIRVTVLLHAGSRVWSIYRCYSRMQASSSFQGQWL